MTVRVLRTELDRVVAAHELAAFLSRPDVCGLPDWFDDSVGDPSDVGSVRVVCDRLAAGTWLVSGGGAGGA